MESNRRRVVTVRAPADGSWLFVLIVVLTLAPSACVLWFMNQAVATDATAARQRVLDAYRGQLRLVRSRLDGVWRAQSARLDRRGPPNLQFSQLITDGLADGAILLDATGGVAYPTRESRHDAYVADLERRAAAIPQLPSSARPAAVSDVALRLNDYSTPLDASSRLLLMDRLRALSPNVWLATQAALHLTRDVLDAERPLPAENVVRQTAVRDVWALTSHDGHVVGLYRTGRVEAMMHDFLHEISPAGVVFIAYPPDIRADAEAIAAGPWLPGWQLSFVPLGLQPFDDTARHRRTVYLSVAIAGVGLITIVGGLAGGGLRRHLRLARLKTDLVAAASHELRTPLASMRVLVDGLLADATFDPAKTREYLQLLAGEHARLSRVIENFLTFSRLDRRRYTFALHTVDAGAIIGAATDAMRERIPAGTMLAVQVDAGLPPVNADVEAMATAIVNLLDNALKYTPGDKRVSIRVQRRDDRFVSFAVSDNGIGIASRDRRRIFRRFVQIDQRLARETGGVGLGLSIVDLIVRGHRGRISVVSAVGRGSTFAIDLPVAS